MSSPQFLTVIQNAIFGKMISNIQNKHSFQNLIAVVCYRFLHRFCWMMLALVLLRFPNLITLILNRIRWRRRITAKKSLITVKSKTFNLCLKSKQSQIKTWLKSSIIFIKIQHLSPIVRVESRKFKIQRNILIGKLALIKLSYLVNKSRVI